MMKYLGIDPGLTGGWAIIDKDSKIEMCGKFEGIRDFYMRYQHFQLANSSIASHPLVSSLEESTLPMIFNPKTRSFMPRKGSQEYKRQVGKWEGALEVIGISNELVRPQKWQKIILGVIEKGKTKEKALQYAQKKWPELNLKKKDDGIVDALCIAEYTRRVHLGARTDQSECISS